MTTKTTTQAASVKGGRRSYTVEQVQDAMNDGRIDYACPSCGLNDANVLGKSETLAEVNLPDRFKCLCGVCGWGFHLRIK